MPEESESSAPAASGNLEHTEGLVRWSQEGGKYILRFINQLTGEPVLSRMAHQFKVEFNIRAGGIQHIATQQGAGSSRTQDIGTLLVDIHGEPQELEAALAFLRQQGVIVEEA